MADENHMMFMRPINCHFCVHGYNGLAHMANYAAGKGLWTITDMTETQANKVPVYN